MNSLIITEDGSHTIYRKELDEHYHSVHGAIGESNFIFIKNGFDFCQADPLNILEIGFGTGLNALLTALKSMRGQRQVNYTSIENYPLDESVTRLLNYHQFTEEEGKTIFNRIHAAPWNRKSVICKNFSLEKTETDFTSCKLSGSYDLIYYDAFGPDKQPEMWTPELLSRIADVTRKGGVFVTYSVKGELKRNLRSFGFNITLLPGPPGKRQIMRAIKN